MEQDVNFTQRLSSKMYIDFRSKLVRIDGKEVDFNLENSKNVNFLQRVGSKMSMAGPNRLKC